MSNSRDLNASSEREFISQIVQLGSEEAARRKELKLICKDENSSDYFQKSDEFIFGKSPTEEGIVFLTKVTTHFRKFQIYRTELVKSSAPSPGLLVCHLNYFELIIKAVNQLLDAINDANSRSIHIYEEEMKGVFANVPGNAVIAKSVERVKLGNEIMSLVPVGDYFVGVSFAILKLDQRFTDKAKQLKDSYDKAVNNFNQLREKVNALQYIVENSHYKIQLESALQNPDPLGKLGALKILFNDIINKDKNVAYSILEKMAELDLQVLEEKTNANNNNNNNNNTDYFTEDGLAHPYVESLRKVVGFKGNLVNSLAIKKASFQAFIYQATICVAKLYEAMIGRAALASHYEEITACFKALISQLSPSDKEKLDMNTQSLIHKCENNILETTEVSFKELSVEKSNNPPSLPLQKPSKKQKKKERLKQQQQQQQQQPSPQPSITILSRKQAQDFKDNFESIHRKASNLLSDEAMGKNEKKKTYFEEVSAWMDESEGFILEVGKQFSLMPTVFLKLDYWKFYTVIATEILKLMNKVGVEWLSSSDKLLPVNRIGILKKQVDHVRQLINARMVNDFKTDDVSINEIKTDYSTANEAFKSLHWEVNVLGYIVHDDKAQFAFKKRLQASSIPEQINALADFYKELTQGPCTEQEADLAYYILEQIFKLYFMALVDVANMSNTKLAEKKINSSKIQLENPQLGEYAKRLLDCIEYQEIHHSKRSEILTARIAVFNKQMDLIAANMLDWFKRLDNDHHMIDTKTFGAMANLFCELEKKAPLLLNQDKTVRKEFVDKLNAQKNRFEEQDKQIKIKKQEKEAELKREKEQYVKNFESLMKYFDENKEQKPDSHKQRKKILSSFTEVAEEAPQQEEVIESDDNNNNNNNNESIVENKPLERFPYTNIATTTWNELEAKLKAAISEKKQSFIAKCHIDLAEYAIKRVTPISALPRLSFISSNMGSFKKSGMINEIVDKLTVGLDALIIARQHLFKCVHTINAIIGARELSADDEMAAFLDGISMRLNDASYLIAQYTAFKTNLFEEIKEQHKRAIEAMGGIEKWRSNPKFNDLEAEDFKKQLSPMALAFGRVLHFNDRFKKVTEQFRKASKIHAELKQTRLELIAEKQQQKYQREIAFDQDWRKEAAKKYAEEQQQKLQPQQHNNLTKEVVLSAKEIEQIRRRIKETAGEFDRVGILKFYDYINLGIQNLLSEMTSLEKQPSLLKAGKSAVHLNGMQMKAALLIYALYYHKEYGLEFFSLLDLFSHTINFLNFLNACDAFLLDKLEVIHKETVSVEDSAQKNEMLSALTDLHRLCDYNHDVLKDFTNDLINASLKVMNYLENGFIETTHNALLNITPDNFKQEKKPAREFLEDSLGEEIAIISHLIRWVSVEMQKMISLGLERDQLIDLKNQLKKFALSLKNLNELIRTQLDKFISESKCFNSSDKVTEEDQSLTVVNLFYEQYDLNYHALEKIDDLEAETVLQKSKSQTALHILSIFGNVNEKNNIFNEGNVNLKKATLN